MMNGVRDLEPSDVPGVLASWVGRADTYVGQADGRRIANFESFFRVVGEALGCPREFLQSINNVHWFYDEVTTLWWFDDANVRPRHQQYVLVVRRADEIRLPDQYDWRDFFEDVARFWGEEVVDVVVAGEKRGFVVYLVHEDDRDETRESSLAAGSAVDDLAKLETGTSRLGPSRVPDATYARLTLGTPTRGIKLPLNRGAPKVGSPDFVVPGLKVTGKFQADRMFPMAHIVHLDGFDRLTQVQQLAILNYQPNFFGLSPSANASRRALSYASWETHQKSGLPISPYIRSQMPREEQVRAEILQAMIYKMLRR